MNRLKVRIHPCTSATGETYRLALSLSSPLASSASACLLRRPGFLCGAQECQRLIHTAGHPAPGPPPQACEGKLNCSGRSTRNILYCCQIPVRQTNIRLGGGHKGCVFFILLNAACFGAPSKPHWAFWQVSIQTQWLLGFCRSEWFDFSLAFTQQPLYLQLRSFTAKWNMTSEKLRWNDEVHFHRAHP